MTRAHASALIVPAAVAIAFLLPRLWGIGFVSDDFVLTNLLDAGGASASWSEIGHQFGERWLYSQAYWRPVVNVVYGLNVDLLGFTPLSLGAVNLALHVGVVVGTAHLCFRARGVRSPVLAAWIGGAFCAVHPATVETVLWISARVSGLEVFFRVMALCAFQAHLRSPSRARYGATVALCALALGSKESAVALPAALLALDLLDEPRRRLRERVRLHGPLVALWVGYALVRVALLGSFVGSPVPEPTPTQLAEILGRKLELLFLPNGLPSLAAWGAFVALALALARVQAQLRSRVGALAILVGWVLASLAPSYKTPLGSGWIGSRMIYDALPVIGLILAHGLGTARRGMERAAAAAVGAAVVGLMIPPAAGYAGAFAEAWEQNATARRQLESVGHDASAERPVGILSVPPCREVPGPTNPVSYFVLGERPFAKEPFPAVGLGSLLDSFPYSEEVYRDPRPVHALLDAGSVVTRWDEGAAAMLTWRRGGTRPRPDRAEGSLLELETPVSPFAFEAIEVVADAGARGGTVAWRTSLGEFGGAVGIPFAGGVADGDAAVFHVDLTRHAPLLALGMAGGEVLGIRVDLDGGAVRSLRAIDRLPEIGLVAELDGRAIPFANLDGALHAPPGDPFVPMRLVLAGEATAFAVPVTPDAPVALPERVTFHVRMFANALRARRFWYWFETEPPQGAPGAARSAVDRFVVTDVPR